MEIKKYTKPWHNDITYYIADTIMLREKIDSYIIIEYYDSETSAYLFNVSSGKVINHQRIYYDNDEGCNQISSKIYENQMIQS